jgi:hypothetical protein
MRSEQSWSLLDPKPVLLYLPKCDDYIVYWNGIAMTHSMALCMSMEQIGIYATPEMKAKLEETYRRIYYANGFGTRAWDGIVELHRPIYSYLKKLMKEHLDKCLVNKDPKDVLQWFDYKRARILEND